MEHHKIINQMKTMVTLMRKKESNHKKVMKLLKGMINMQNNALGLQRVDNELNELKLQSSDIENVS